MSASVRLQSPQATTKSNKHRPRSPQKPPSTPSTHARPCSTQTTLILLLLLYTTYDKRPSLASARGAAKTTSLYFGKHTRPGNNVYARGTSSQTTYISRHVHNTQLLLPFFFFFFSVFHVCKKKKIITTLPKNSRL